MHAAAAAERAKAEGVQRFKELLMDKGVSRPLLLLRCRPEFAGPRQLLRFALAPARGRPRVACCVPSAEGGMGGLGAAASLSPCR